MTPLQATETIYAAAVAGMGSTPLTFEGERYTPTAGTSWVRVSVRDSPSGPMTHGPSGGRRIERPAVVYGQVFTPYGTDDGVAAAMTLAQTFRDLFEGRDLTATGGGSLTFLGASVRRVGIDGAWYQVNVECPFTHDETI